MTRPPFWLALLALSLASGPAFASPDRAAPGGDAWRPGVPVSAFGLPRAWLDPSRMQFATELRVGTGFGGAAEGLHLTRLRYQVAEPLVMRISLGSAFGSRAAAAGQSFFLEGLDLAYRPTPSLLVQFHYQDIRSSLQLGRPGFSEFRP